MASAELSPLCRRCLGKQLDCPIRNSPGMARLCSIFDSLSRRNCTVLVHGESGSGKEVVARHLHAMGPRRLKPFVPVDCTALRETLFESQLFGHVKGAFTGAGQSTLGFFRAADGGTLFLDEIGEMAPSVQAKLLRCIQDRAVVPLGGVDPVPVDVRIIAATHRDLKAMVARGEFRQDLYFRLNVVRIEVPPLRERRSEIGTLARHFLDQFARIDGQPPKALSPEAARALEAYSWPGNVRELANVVEQAHIFTGGDLITVENLPEEVKSASVDSLSEDDSGIVPLAAAECALIARALRAAAGNQSRAAAMLQIDRRRLYRKVRNYGLTSLLRAQADEEEPETSSTRPLRREPPILTPLA